VREGVELPEVFSVSAVPDAPLSLPPDEIAEHRDEWIEAWTNIVLR